MHVHQHAARRRQGRQDCSGRSAKRLASLSASSCVGRLGDETRERSSSRGCATAGNGGVIAFTTRSYPASLYALCETVMPGWMTTLGPTPLRRLQPERRQQHRLHGLQRCARGDEEPRDRQQAAAWGPRPHDRLLEELGFLRQRERKPEADPRSDARGRRAGRDYDRHAHAARWRLCQGGPTAGQVDDRHRQEDGLGSGLQPRSAVACRQAEHPCPRRQLPSGSDGNQRRASTPCRRQLQRNHALQAGTAQATQTNSLAATLDRYNNSNLC